jgi:hypothetical protein
MWGNGLAAQQKNPMFDGESRNFATAMALSYL